jgi:cellulose synthase/poly-beta-1,6-N-acetylglucosamine synthase-like glycosyltransferase
VKLSFCITCWDQDFKYLKRLLPYLESQTKLPDKFIISSSTLSEDQIQSVPKEIKGTPVTFINSKKALYAGGARNQGASICETEFITFFDIDDIPHPQKIEITYTAFSNLKADCFTHNLNTYQKQFESIEKPFNFDLITQSVSIYLKPPNNSYSEVTHGHLSCRTNIFKNIKYNESMRRGQDSDFCMRLLKNKYNIYYSPEILISYFPSIVSRVSK